jgi:hypothetical protein
MRKILSKKFILLAIAGGVTGYLIHFAAVCAGTT